MAFNLGLQKFQDSKKKEKSNKGMANRYKHCYISKNNNHQKYWYLSHFTILSVDHLNPHVHVLIPIHKGMHHNKGFTGKVYCCFFNKFGIIVYPRTRDHFHHLQAPLQSAHLTRGSSASVLTVRTCVKKQTLTLWMLRQLRLKCTSSCH